MKTWLIVAMVVIGSACLVNAQTVATPCGDVAMFPADNPWNQDISKLPVHPKSAQYLAKMNPSKGIKPDFGTFWEGRPMGMSYVVVGAGQKKITIESFAWPDECDAGPYPIPDDAPIEGGPTASDDSDRHVLVIDCQEKKLYELYHAFRTATGWKAGSGAIFDLTNNAMRPAGWTSADAAGLPIFPGLVRYDEVMEKGEIKHALRFTVRKTQRAYIHPARHYASRSTDGDLPPMGLRVRLRGDYDISGFPKEAQVILAALKTYGMILADNGSDWFISGIHDPRWGDDATHAIRRVHGSDFEVVDTGPVITNPADDR